MGTTNSKLRRNSIKPSHVTSNRGNWNDLPEEILASILSLLPSIADLAYVASVSHLWNNAAAAAASNNGWAPHRPPLLLTSFLPEIPRYNLTTLESHPTSNPYYRSSALSFQTIANSFCVGRHFSSLIMVKNAFIILHDVFSGEQIRSPEFPLLKDLQFASATLTAPLHSSSLSLVLLVALEIDSLNHSVLCWEPNGNGDRDGKFAVDAEIKSFALFKDQVYYVDLMRRVGVVEFEPKMNCRLLGDMSGEILPTWSQESKLVECDGDLLIVLFISTPSTQMKIMVYKLDLEKREWVKKEKLNNWCLFIDMIGETGFSCKDPERWGGRSNCIYVANCIRVPGCLDYIICPLNAEIDRVNRDRLLKSYAQSTCFPIWVYPNMSSRRPRHHHTRGGSSSQQGGSGSHPTSGATDVSGAGSSTGALVYVYTNSGWIDHASQQFAADFDAEVKRLESNGQDITPDVQETIFRSLTDKQTRRRNRRPNVGNIPTKNKSRNQASTSSVNQGNENEESFEAKFDRLEKNFHLLQNYIHHMPPPPEL